MCFYDQYQWECGDWKWDRFRQHCQAEYRMGETCGQRYILDTLPLQGCCTWCEAINKKKRKYEKTKADYARWYNDPTKQASAEKAYREMEELAAEIKTMQAAKEARMKDFSGGNRRRGQSSKHARA